MQEQLSALFELQVLDLRINQINATLAAATGARQLRIELASAKSQLEVAEKALMESEVELKDAELQLKSVDEKRSGYEKRLYSGTVTNPKELGAMEKEVAILKEQQAKLDSRTLALYDQVETARKTAEQLRQTTADLTKQVRQVLAEESATKTELEAELAELTSKREAAARKVTNKPLMARYNAVRARNGGMGIARVIEGKCEGCRISVMPFMVRELMQPKDIRTCESCGRILFIKKDPKTDA